jgi:hypothetical protein
MITIYEFNNDTKYYSGNSMEIEESEGIAINWTREQLPTIPPNLFARYDMQLHQWVITDMPEPRMAVVDLTAATDVVVIPPHVVANAVISNSEPVKIAGGPTIVA